MNSLSIEKEELMTEARKLRNSINDLCGQMEKCGECPLYKTILCNESIADMLDDVPTYLKDRL